MSHNNVLDRPSIAYRPFVTNFTLLVVDGNGIEVASEPVTISFLDAQHGVHSASAVTDSNGRVGVVETHENEPQSVVIDAAGESTGPLTVRPGAMVVVEV
ncbi:MAG: hypothetical protein WEA76_08290 [Acidimicrobiia bacterium]